MPPETGHEKIEQLIIENQRLLAENNMLLKKLHKGAVWAFWLRILWLAVFLGLPILAFYYIFVPYYETLQTTFESLRIGLPEFPSWGE